MISNSLVAQLKKYDLRSEMDILLEEDSLRPLKVKAIINEGGRVKMILEKASIENKPEPVPEPEPEPIEEPVEPKNPLLVDEEEDGE